MQKRIGGLRRTGLTLLLTLLAVTTAAEPFVPLAERIERLAVLLDQDLALAGYADDTLDLRQSAITVHDCGSYPYSEGAAAPRSASIDLVRDLSVGLRQGLSCLAGHGEPGRLHPYHEYQAHRLLTLLESEAPKTFQCVEDDMFAVAVATSPQGTTLTDPLFRQLRSVSFPGVVLDTYRLGGVLSRRHDDETYREFFHLADEQIYEHRNGQPLRPANLHRYRDRPGLLFHEVVHWLGHEHSALYPDMAHLYETCCFGAEYISDAALAAGHRQTACTILRDDELWSNSYSRNRQMRIWHHKGYDQFKGAMRDDYDS
ncbi:MAG: hypothetical protein KDI88_12755 [Gammaproteobacteria bacterium]|nr:hypothetical protein [Gammaproteobacteria bacterium]